MAAYTASISDTVSTFDSFSGIEVTWLVSTAETLSATDVPVSLHSAVRATSDVVSVRLTQGNLWLPLLFTYGPDMDSATRTVNAIGSARKIADTLVTLDSLARQNTSPRALTDSLVTSDTYNQVQTDHRLFIETTSLSDAITFKMQRRRAVTETIGVSFAGSPMLLFSTLNNDVLARTIGIHRAFVDTIPTTDLLRKAPGYNRVYIESIPTTDVTGRRSVYGRLVPVSGTTSDVLGRSAALKRSDTETLTLLDTLRRSMTATRVLSDQTASMGYAMVPGLVFTQPGFVSTWDTIVVFPYKPRFLTETLTTSDRITLEQLQLAIMGYIWVDNTGHVISQMPDWGYVLIEDPAAGNTMNVVEIPVTSFNPTREK